MKIKRLHILWIVTMLSNSCSIDDRECIVPQDDYYDKGKGRFYNSPFRWDYKYSADKGDTLHLVFASDFLNAGSRNEEAMRRARKANPDGGRRYGGRYGTDERNGQSENLFGKEGLLITNPAIVYLGAAYPEKTFGASFKEECLYPRNPIDVSFRFRRPFTGKITDEYGMMGYDGIVAQALNSDRYEDHIKSKKQEYLDFYCTEHYSYSDIEKVFKGNAGLAGMFVTKINYRNYSANIKSRLLGMLVSKHFSIVMNVPPHGFFKDKSKDSSPENPVYVSSVTYGRVAFISVESEYSFHEVEKALRAAINYKVLSLGANYTEKDMEIMAKANINLLLISPSFSGNQFFDSLDSIKNSFNPDYPGGNEGHAIFCQGNYTKDNSGFKLPESRRTGSREYKKGERIGGGRSVDNE